MSKQSPMLSASLPTGLDADLEKLDWSAGFMVSPKIDGIRSIKTPDQGMVSRTLKPIRNKHIQKCMAELELFNYVDGELIIGTIDKLLDYNTNQSGIMSADGSPFFTYCTFDSTFVPSDPFSTRNGLAASRLMAIAGHNKNRWATDNFEIVHLEQRLVMNMDELMEFELEKLALGFEGVIIRDPRRPYKFNRSTFKEQGMIKLKRFEDGEAKIVGFEELYHNTNEPTKDARGYQVRSSALGGQVPGNMLGRLLCVGVTGTFVDVAFAIGSGFDHSLRRRIWNDQSHYLDKIVKFKYQPHGSKDRPRSPIFLGFRTAQDM